MPNRIKNFLFWDNEKCEANLLNSFRDAIQCESASGRNLSTFVLNTEYF